MLKEVKIWLENKKRDYCEGVALFEQLASDGIKEKYLAFFQKAKAPSVSSPEFTMLVNKITDIKRNLVILGAQGKTMPVPTTPQPAKGGSGNQKPAATTAVEFGQINADELPEDLKADYDRLKEIRPLQAKYHADVKNATLDADERHAAAVALVALEEERKERWLKLEVHFGSNVGVAEEEQEQESDFQRGVKAAQRIARLKENIANNKVAEANAKKPAQKDRAKKKRMAYEKELTAILKELSAK